MNVFSRHGWVWCCALLAACGGGGAGLEGRSAPIGRDTPAAAEAPVERVEAVVPIERPQAAVVERNAAMQIARDGHGLLFDARGALIEPSPRFIATVQQGVRAEVDAETGGRIDDETQAWMKRADVLLADETIGEADKLTLQGGIAWRLLQGTRPETIQRLEWRLEAANLHIQDVYKPGSFQLDPRVSELLLGLRYFDLDWRFPYFRSYAERCRRNGVPVPPDFAVKGTAWVHRGALAHNILSQGQGANVWTWADPAKRGVCIALPRQGTPALAGIICQSATTGAACFWDNLDAKSGARINWQTETLKIASLKNGASLTENCTNCHRGNNVYLVAPDDPTWAKLLRPLPGTVPSTQTLRVEASSDTRGGRPRYLPVTGLVPRPDWINVYNSSASCSGCHESPPSSLFTPSMNPPSMPPVCNSLPGGCGS